ncbi:MAG: hypothetical protein IPH31_18225 [Lewinellaceae bacterium]|nr:hypothetical protein [Lewinellaceae bacterium]
MGLYEKAEVLYLKSINITPQESIHIYAQSLSKSSKKDSYTSMGQYEKSRTTLL